MYQPSRLATSTVYPREYCAAGFWKGLLLLCSLVLLCGGIAGICFAVAGQFDRPSARIWFGGLFFVFVVLSAYVLLWLFKSKIVLFPDRISIEELTSTKVFHRDELRGWRMMPTSPPTLVLESKENRRAVKVGLVFPLDDEFLEWFDAVPSLDVQEAEASKAEIREDPRLGLTRSERTRVWEEGAKRAKLLSGASTVVCVWAIFYPRPYDPLVLLLAVLPWVAIAMVKGSGGLIRADEVRNDAHPNVAVALISPGLALSLRAVLDYEVLGYSVALALSLVIGGAMAFAALTVDPATRKKTASAVGLFVFSLAYGYGIVIEANCLLDRSQGVSYSAIVQGKHVNNGKHTSYELELGAWGPKTAPNELEIGKATYGHIQPGDVAFLRLKQGALGMKWFYMRSWQKPDAASSSQ